MKTSPLMNASIATVYIFCIVLFLQLLEKFFGDTPDTWIAPIAALSLLVFSVALMAFLFFYQPVVLLIDRRSTEARSFFIKTLLSFGSIVILLFLILSVL